MSTGPPLVPSRVSALAAVEADWPDQRLLLVTAAAGGGLTTFLRALAASLSRQPNVGRCDVLTALPWVEEPGSTLAPLAERQPPTGGLHVVIVADAHFADEESIQGAVSRAKRHPHTVVVIGWAGPAQAPASSTQRRWHGHRPTRLRELVVASADRVVDLPAVDAADVAALAEQRGVVLPAGQADRIVRHCGGNIRSVTELLAQVPARDWSAPHFSLPASATAARSVAAWTEEIGADATRLLASVAVLETGNRQAWASDVHVAAQLATVPDIAVALDPALRSGLLLGLDEQSTWVRLRDPLTRRALLDQLGPLGRRDLHARAATMLTDPGLAVRHEWYADPTPCDTLAQRLEDQATQSARSGAWANAADLLLLAARASTSEEGYGDRLIWAVDALVGAGEVPRASRYLADLESLRETPARNAVLGYLAVVRGRAGEAENRLRRAWELVNPTRDPETASVIAQRTVLHHLARARPRDLVEWADRAIELAEPVDPNGPAALESAAIRGLGVAARHGTDRALAEYAALAERVPDGPVSQRVAMASGWLRLAADQPELAAEELRSAIGTEALGGSLRISLWARAWLARTQFLTGDWDDALRTATGGVELAHRSGMGLLLPLLEWTRTQIFALRGEFAAAEGSLRAGEATSRDYELMRVPAALARAALSEARADYPGVVRALAPLEQPWALDWINRPGFWPWADVYAHALVVTGQLEQADEFLNQHESAGHVSHRARLSYARGRWYGVQGELEAARDCFEGAIADLTPLPLGYDLARVHLTYGQTLRRAGRRADADAVISTARDGFLSLGASTFVARCERELAAGGVNITRSGRDFDDLTPQEEAVAALVCSGRSNKDVAAELFVSVKTVQYHLTRIYAKVGVRSRTELAAKWSAPTTTSGS